MFELVDVADAAVLFTIRWTDRDAIRGTDSRGLNVPCVR